ncbi:hypothetical protein [Streptomyces sp. NPDC013181]
MTDGLLTSPRYKWTYGPWTQPGGLSKATCESGWNISWYGIVVSG